MADTYVSTAELTFALPTSNLDDAVLADLAVKGASRAVDSYCGQTFFQSDDVRYYLPRYTDLVKVHPIATATGLIVKTDTAGDGTYATTLTINTDFLLRPTNAATLTPAQPYTQIWLPSSSFPTFWSGRETVQVTATFGWPAVPDDIKAATLLLARDLFKELKDAPFGVAGTSEFGVLRIRQNQTARDLLSRYQRPLVG